MSKCNEKDVSYRGPSHPQQIAYTDTIADYTVASTGDNVKQNITCDASVAVGDVVRMNGATAVKAIATSFLGSSVVGIVTSKPTGTTCDITVCGPITSILTGLDVTKQYFLSDSTAGALVTTPPTTSGNYVIRLGNAINSTTFAIHLERVVKRA